MTQFERRAQRFTDSRFSPPVSLFSQPRQLKHDLSELLRQKHRLQYFSTKENPERLLRIFSFCRGAETGHFKHCCVAFSARLCHNLGFQFRFFLFYFVDSSSLVMFSFPLPVLLCLIFHPHLSHVSLISPVLCSLWFSNLISSLPALVSPSPVFLRLSPPAPRPLVSLVCN